MARQQRYPQSDCYTKALEIVTARARAHPAFEESLDAAREAAAEIAALPATEIVARLRELGGWSEVIHAAFEQAAGDASVNGGAWGDYPIRDALTATDVETIRLAAQQA